MLPMRANVRYAVRVCCCSQVLCPLPPKFFQQFLLEGTDRHGHREVRNHISHLNPIKYHCAEFLIDYHRNRGDKILIFFHSLRSVVSCRLRIRLALTRLAASEAALVRKLFIHLYECVD